MVTAFKKKAIKEKKDPHDFFSEKIIIESVVGEGTRFLSFEEYFFLYKE